MPTIARAFLCAVLVLLLVACASQSAKQGPDDTAATHDLVSPLARALPAGAAAKQPGTAAKSGTPTPDAAAAGATAWPLLLTFEGATFQVHEPVVETLNDGILTARSVVTAQASDQGQLALGWLTMRGVAEVDSASAVASLVDTEVLRVSFPTGVDNTQAWQEFLRFAVPPKIKTVPRATLESGRIIDQARQRAATAATAPATRIIVSERPAVLVYIDDDPRYVPVKGTDLMGVLNTRVMLLKDPLGNFYLHVYNGWVRAASLDGPWEMMPNAPDTQGLEQAVRESGRANLLLGKAGADGSRPVLSAGHLPEIIVTTKLTALILLDGPPRYTSVAGTTLQYAVNTSAHLFRDTASGEVYVRVEGFWFRTADINGAWWHVPIGSLPAAFSAIPDDSPKRAVKASIAGAQMPTSASQMKVVVADSFTAPLSIRMAGDPVLQPIRGTDLNYVANASVPVIQIDINNWYAVQNGVWYYSNEATGPWTITKRIPPEIYAIPPGVPIYRAIHSRVMASSTDVTYYGYPGDDAQGSEGGAIGIEEQGADYQYTPPSGMSWGWYY